jgi:hypothetical protein
MNGALLKELVVALPVSALLVGSAFVFFRGKSSVPSCSYSGQAALWLPFSLTSAKPFGFFLDALGTRG